MLPMKTPLLPKSYIHKIVFNEADKIFTKLFQIIIIPNRIYVIWRSLFARIADLFFCFIRCLSLKRLRAIMPVSALEKKAERQRRVNILDRSIQMGISFKLVGESSEN